MQAFSYPHDGIIYLTQTGEITELDEQGLDHGFLVNDVIKSVNGEPFVEVIPFYAQMDSGDEVIVTVERDGRTEDLKFKLASPPWNIILEGLVSLFVALIFWAIGVGVLAFKPSDAASNLFFVFCQLSSLLLATGLASAAGSEPSSNTFNFLIWLIGPITVHFHLYFPQSTRFRGRTALISFLYGIAMLGGLPYLIWGTKRVDASQWGDQLATAGLLFLAINLLIAVVLLFHAFRYAGSPGVRGKIRIVLLGGAMSLLPVVMLTILPDALSEQPLVPYSYSFLFLSILPLTYGYAIIRHRLIEIDRHINRGARIFIIFSILGGIYAVLYTVLPKVVPEGLATEALINTLLVLILAGIFSPLYRQVQRIVDTAFYGGWYDYRSAVTQITQGLEQITDLPELAKIISNRLVKTLQLEDSIIFLRDLEGDFSVIEVAPTPKAGENSRMDFAALPKNSLTYLLNIGAMGRNTLRQALAEAKLSPEELRLLNSEQVYLWVPVIGHGQVLGLLALGAKLGGDIFSGEDMDILRIVAQQMAPLIENIHLVTRLRQYAAGLEQRVEERTAELHASKERVEAVLSSVGDGVFVTDLNGKILTVNRAFEDQSGYSGNEIVGKQMFNLVNSHNDQEMEAEIRSALESQFNWSGELMAERKGGRPYDVHLTIAPVRNQDGEIMGYVGSQRDITQSKELERLKDQFILEVSHELRTPVTNMGLYAELLERGKPERKVEYLAILRSEINQLMRMIEDILDLSRLEVGKYKKATFSMVDVNLLAEQVVAAHAPLAQEAGLNLVFIPGEDLPRISGEQNQLARVLTNLISNAIRYTPAGSVQVITYTDPRGLCVEIKDTGIGIDPEDLPHLYERFYRGKAVSQSKIIGSGLGLAIVKEIVELHDGQIQCESAVGKGTTFRVWLPAPQVEVLSGWGMDIISRR